MDVDAVSSSHLKNSGATTGEGEGVFSRRHWKISGATTGDDEVVSAEDVEDEVVCYCVLVRGQWETSTRLTTGAA